MKREFCTSCKSTITVDGLGNRVVCENERLKAINAELLAACVAANKKADAAIKKATGEE